MAAGQLAWDVKHEDWAQATVGEKQSVPQPQPVDVSHDIDWSELNRQMSQP